METLWNHEKFANEEEAKLFIQFICETYPAFNSSNITNDSKVLAWSWILCNDEPYKEIDGLSESSLRKYGSELSQSFKQLLNSLHPLVNDVQVELDRDNLTLVQKKENKKTEIIKNKSGYGVIAAARLLEKLFIIYPFYKSKEWKDFITETNGKLSIIGFQPDNYPRTEEFYIEPDFSNSESNKIKESIAQPKARILITGESGIGKTAYLKHLAMLCYRQKICQYYIPIYISLRRSAFLEHHLSQELSGKPIDIYMSVINNNWGVKLTHEQVINVLVNGKALVLIDGLDVNHINSFNHFNQIKEFISMYPKNSFVISSKGLDFLTNSLSYGKIEIFELKSFNRIQARNFIENYLITAKAQYSSENINQFLDCYSESLGTKDYTPLLLSCLCCYAINRSDKSTSTPEPEKKFNSSTELIQKSISNFIADWDEVRSPDNSDPYFLLLEEQRIKLLGFLAIRFMQGVNHNGNQANVPANKDTVLDWIIEFINQVDIKKTLHERYSKLDSNYSIESISSQNKIANYILNSIEFQDGLIVERYKAKGEISFIHGGIQKYLAAEYLSDLGLTELGKFLSLEGEWEEVVQQALRLRESRKKVQ